MDWIYIEHLLVWFFGGLIIGGIVGWLYAWFTEL